MRILSMVVFLGLCSPCFAIKLLTRDSVVWAREQRIEGEGSGSRGTLKVNGNEIPFQIKGGRFSVPVSLSANRNEIVACIQKQCSEPRHLELGYALRPKVEIRARKTARGAILEARAVENPEGGPVLFEWVPDARNPAPLRIEGTPSNRLELVAEESSPEGEYFFDAWAFLPRSEEAPLAPKAKSRVLLRLTNGELKPFNTETDRAGWIDSAVIYGIAPWHYSPQEGRKLRDIMRRIPELVDLGMNTLWLQPLFENREGGQGYDVVDHFKLWKELGTEEDLKELVGAAHAFGMRVVLDFVANHSAVAHPYAQEAAEFGEASHYFDFYMHASDGAPQSEHYQVRDERGVPFISYFWPRLVNFDFSSREVRRMLTEAARFWVERFDIDGYRFDASWGPVARRPDFFPALKKELKALKPDLLLIAETEPSVSTPVFDAAYDGVPSEEHVYEWAWQRGNPGETLFNSTPEGERSRELRQSIHRSLGSRAVVVRFLENNDTVRFRSHHSVAQTKLAATLQFTLPGIPMLYYGQEIGVQEWLPRFPAGRALREWDSEKLWSHYQGLAKLRLSLPELRGGRFEEIPVLPNTAAGSVFAFRRIDDGGATIVVANLGETDRRVTLGLAPEEEQKLSMVSNTATGKAEPVSFEEIAALGFAIEGYGTRLILVR